MAHATAEVKREARFANQAKRAASPQKASRPPLRRASQELQLRRPTLHRSHSLTRVPARTDAHPGEPASRHARPENQQRSTRPALRKSQVPRNDKENEVDNRVPVMRTHTRRPSNAAVIRVLVVDWCISMKLKCKAVV
ncbi:hypothetical protein C8Q77DRAFT_1154844 [Trametes polyzona]|nr:hypothetical protein C8Q77DRAFT_1154844 [Trametes polyzona]